jgi:hypothetical protein
MQGGAGLDFGEPVASGGFEDDVVVADAAEDERSDLVSDATEPLAAVCFDDGDGGERVAGSDDTDEVDIGADCGAFGGVGPGFGLFFGSAMAAKDVFLGDDAEPLEAGIARRVGFGSGGDHHEEGERAKEKGVTGKVGRAAGTRAAPRADGWTNPGLALLHAYPPSDSHGKAGSFR